MDATNIEKPRLRIRRRVYGRDFKLQIVRGVAQGLRPADIVRDYGISRIMVARWLREWQKDPAHAFRGYGQRKPVLAQLERLRRRNKKLQAERDLLKKASAHFALLPNTHSTSLQNIEMSGRLDGCARFSMSRRAGITSGCGVAFEHNLEKLSPA